MIVLNESKAEQILGVVFFVIGLIGALVIVPMQIAYVEGAYPQPRFFPQLICGLTAVLGVFLFIGGRRKRNAKDQETYTFVWKEVRLVLITLGVIALYVIAMNWIPYLPATIIVLAVLMFIYGQRNWIKLAAVAILLPAIIYVGLSLGLQLRLP